MTRDQQVKIDAIIRDNTMEVLKKYLTDDLARKICNEIRSGAEWDIANMEEEA